MNTMSPPKPADIERVRQAFAKKYNPQDFEPGGEIPDVPGMDEEPITVTPWYLDQLRLINEHWVNMLTSPVENARLRETKVNEGPVKEPFLSVEKMMIEVRPRVEIGGVSSLDFSGGKGAVAEAERIASTGSEVSSVVTPGVEKDNFLKDYAPEINFGLLFGVLVKGGKELFGAAIKRFKENVTFKEQPNQAEMTPEQIKAKEEEAKRKKIVSENAQRIVASVQSAPSMEAQRALENEDRQINSVIGRQVSAKVERGIFGRLKVYYQTLFERGQLDADAAKKKQEKEASLRQATKSGDGDLYNLLKQEGNSTIQGPNAGAG